MSIKTLYNDFYGDETRWWVGVVESINDPIKQGRVRVRIYGIHSASPSDIPPSALPWAQVVAPVTQGGTSGINGTPVGIQPYAQVFGIFLDGKHSQLPLVLGSIPRVDGKKPDLVTGAGGETRLAVAGEVNLESAGARMVDPDAADPRAEAARTNPTPDPGIPPRDTGGTTSHGGKSYDSYVLEGGSNAEKAYNFLENVFRSDMGLPNSKELAAGFVGNFMTESGTKLQYDVENSIGAVGIAQWLGERRTALRKYAENNGMQLFLTSKGGHYVPDLKGQLSFVVHELQTLGWLKFDDWGPKASTAAMAADRIEAYYEISEFSVAEWKKDQTGKKVLWKFAPYETRRQSGRDSVGAYGKRLFYAEDVYNQLATTGVTV
jgi:hypothetical protein